MFYLSKLVILTNKNASAGSIHGSQEIDEASDNVTISLLLTKMCNVAKYESSQTPKLTQKVGIRAVLASI